MFQHCTMQVSDDVKTDVVSSTTCKDNSTVKMFVGGLTGSITKELLAEYFSTIAEVLESFVVYENHKPSGFGFITVKSQEEADTILNMEHSLQGSKLDVKPALDRAQARRKEMNDRKRKVFVGGLPKNFPDTELQRYFERFGPVQKSYVAKDPMTGKTRGFGFIIFGSDEALSNALGTENIVIQGCEVHIKKATTRQEEFKNSNKNSKNNKNQNNVNSHNNQRNTVNKQHVHEQSRYHTTTNSNSTHSQSKAGKQHNKHSNVQHNMNYDSQNHQQHYYNQNEHNQQYWRDEQYFSNDYNNRQYYNTNHYDVSHRHHQQHQGHHQHNQQYAHGQQFSQYDYINKQHSHNHDVDNDHDDSPIHRPQQVQIVHIVQSPQASPHQSPLMSLGHIADGSKHNNQKGSSTYEDREAQQQSNSQQYNKNNNYYKYQYVDHEEFDSYGAHNEQRNNNNQIYSMALPQHKPVVNNGYRAVGSGIDIKQGGSFNRGSPMLVFPTEKVIARGHPSGPIVMRKPGHASSYHVPVPVSLSAHAIDTNHHLRYEPQQSRPSKAYRLNPFGHNEDDDEEGEPLQRAEEL